MRARQTAASNLPWKRKQMLSGALMLRSAFQATPRLKAVTTLLKTSMAQQIIFTRHPRLLRILMFASIKKKRYNC